MTTAGLLLVALAAGYLASIRLHPLRRCPACHGTGKHPGAVFTRTYRDCRRCRGGGGLPRWGTTLTGGNRR
jgi:DnaJ-class molecular chaperone